METKHCKVLSYSFLPLEKEKEYYRGLLDSLCHKEWEFKELCKQLEVHRIELNGMMHLEEEEDSATGEWIYIKVKDYRRIGALFCEFHD
jgi:hypothetical protein